MTEFLKPEAISEVWREARNEVYIEQHVFDKRIAELEAELDHVRQNNAALSVSRDRALDQVDRLEKEKDLFKSRFEAAENGWRQVRESVDYLNSELSKARKERDDSQKVRGELVQQVYQMDLQIQALKLLLDKTALAFMLTQAMKHPEGILKTYGGKLG